MGRKRLVNLIFIACIVTLVLFSCFFSRAKISNVLFEKRNNNLETISKKDELMALNLADVYALSREELLELKNEEGDWQAATLKLIKNKHKKSLSNEKITNFMDKGYDLYDIGKAEFLTAYCNMSPEELLNYKKKLESQQEPNTNVEPAIDHKSNIWNKVAKELNIDTRQPVEKTGITQTDVVEMKKQGLTDRQIIDIAELSVNYKKDYKIIWNEMKSGKSRDDIKNEFSKNSCNKSRPVINETDIKITENMLIGQFKVSIDEINLYRGKGLNYNEIAIAKLISNISNLKLSEVVEKKKENEKWDELLQRIRGGKG